MIPFTFVSHSRLGLRSHVCCIPLQAKMNTRTYARLMRCVMVGRLQVRLQITLKIMLTVKRCWQCDQENESKNILLKS